MATPTSLAGQSVRGSIVSSPWFPDKAGQGGWEVTQGWGVTDVDLEPPGHGRKLWHAGVDIGVDCGTIISLPHEIVEASVRTVINPGGYGIAAVVTIRGAWNDRPQVQALRSVDIWFGHCATVVASGKIRGGAHIAVSNNSGNSTGCHTHIEVRPAGGGYGADVDPSQWILNPVQAAASIGALTAGTGTDPLTAAIEAAFQPVAASITTAEQRFVAGLVGSAQVGLGGLMMVGGLGMAALGARGQTAQQAGATAQRFVAGRYRSNQRAAAGYAREQAGEQLAGQRTEASAAREAGRETARTAAQQRAHTLGSYRAGLISRAEAQRRLGEPVRATGKRPTRVAFGGGAAGVYRSRGGGTIQVSRAQRVRTSRIKGAKLPAPTPARPPTRAPSTPPF